MEEVNDWNNCISNCYWCCCTFCDINVQLTDSVKNRVKNAWSQIDVQLKRRHDLIPNLLETVKGYMKHEREIMENITKYQVRRWMPELLVKKHKQKVC